MNLKTNLGYQPKRINYLDPACDEYFCKTRLIRKEQTQPLSTILDRTCSTFWPSTILDSLLIWSTATEMKRQLPKKTLTK